VENESLHQECQVCKAKVPTYACGVCLLDAPIFKRGCWHCGTRQKAMPRLRRKLAQHPEAVFERADIDCSGDLTLEEWQRALGDEVIDKDVLTCLFEEFDTNKDGKVCSRCARRVTDPDPPEYVADDRQSLVQAQTCGGWRVGMCECMSVWVRALTAAACRCRSTSFERP
jgi:hypothetical protein